MESSHQIFMESAHNMAQVDDQSIDLVVTSPPYPMIKLWDDQFARADPGIGKALAQNDFNNAFVLMHAHLEGVWKEVTRTLKPGGIACINIGDATRSFEGHFYDNRHLYSFSLHSKIKLAPCLAPMLVTYPNNNSINPIDPQASA